MQHADAIQDGRYVDDVMHLIKDVIRKHGIVITDYEAKIFGGGNMMPDRTQNIEDSIGAKSATASMTLLMADNVAIMVAHAGEFDHRRRVFDVESGSEWGRHSDNDTGQTGIVDGKV